MVSDGIEIVAHAQRLVITDIEGTPATCSEQGEHAGAGQIIGMDVVAVAVCGGLDDRRSCTDARHRQTIGCVDAGRSQDAGGHSEPSAPVTQQALGSQAAPRPRRSGPQWRRLGDVGTLVVAVDATGADINQTAWYSSNSQCCQGSFQTRVSIPVGRRWRGVDDPVGASREAGQRTRVVEVTDHDSHASRAQTGHLRPFAHQRSDAPLLRQKSQQTKGDIATADE